jgi:hypothetical protein
MGNIEELNSNIEELRFYKCTVIKEIHLSTLLIHSAAELVWNYRNSKLINARRLIQKSDTTNKVTKLKSRC